MKKALVLVAILLLTNSLAWAEGTPEAAASEAVGQANSGPVEGGCTLPDFTGLSADQRLVAALAAGFQMDGAVNRQVAICPTTFLCSSIANCGAVSPCTIQDLGQQCCGLSGGGTFCCASGTIKVRRCPCDCIALPCQPTCHTSTDVTLHCP